MTTYEDTHKKFANMASNEAASPCEKDIVRNIVGCGLVSHLFELKKTYFTDLARPRALMGRWPILGT